MPTQKRVPDNRTTLLQRPPLPRSITRTTIPQRPISAGRLGCTNFNLFLATYAEDLFSHFIGYLVFQRMCKQFENRPFIDQNKDRANTITTEWREKVVDDFHRELSRVEADW